MDIKDIFLGIVAGGGLLGILYKVVDTFVFNWLKKRNPLKFITWSENKLDYLTNKILGYLQQFDDNVLDKGAKKLKKSVPELKSDITLILQRMQKTSNKFFANAIEIFK